MWSLLINIGVKSHRLNPFFLTLAKMAVSHRAAPKMVASLIVFLGTAKTQIGVKGLERSEDGHGWVILVNLKWWQPQTA